jgi:putative transcriptional regulator
LVQITSDIELSGAGCTTAITPNQLVQSSSENDISQAVFAAYLNASISTVQKWENGDKKPSGAAARLLSVIERKGLEVLV